MFKNSPLSRSIVICILWILASCASTRDTEPHGKTGDSESPGKLYLGEVSFILTKDQIVADQLGSIKMKDFYKSILAEGFTDKEIDAGQVIAIQGSIYWVNTVSGLKHNRFTVALLPKGMAADPGNIVEVRDPGRPHFYTVERVRARNFKEGQCGYVEMLAPLPLQLTRDILGFISLVGPPGNATLYCKGIESEGWVREGGYWTKKPAPSSTPSK